MKKNENLFENDNHLDDLYNVDAICIYGKGDHYYKILENFIKSDQKKIVFLEDDKKAFDDLKKIIKEKFLNKNVECFLLENPMEKTILEIAWGFVYLNIRILKSLEKNIADFCKIKSFLNEYHLGVNVTSFVYSDFGIQSFENIFNNLLKVNEFQLFNNFKNTFKNIPAIIVGAGPSLDKNMHLLHEMYDKSLIFAGGAALNILTKKNIRFHFSSHIDQNLHFNRFKMNHFFENNFFYQNKVNHENLSLIHANKILFPSETYPLEKWIYEKLNIYQNSEDIGWTVTTFLIKIAKLLGCNPITFVGFDLSYKSRKYAKGVIREKNLYELIPAKDINDVDVYTQKDWLAAKSWLEGFIKNSDGEFFNATEGGLNIENAKNIKLNDFSNMCKNTYDLHGMSVSIFNNEKKIKLKSDEVLEILGLIKKSIINSNILCDEYIEELSQNIIDSNLIRFQKEIFYIYLLDPLWQIWKHVILREVEKNEIHILLNKLLFFKNVITNHLDLMEKILC